MEIAETCGRSGRGYDQRFFSTTVSKEFDG